MDRETIQTFVLAAEEDLASVRSSLLIVAQTADGSDLAVPRGILARLRGSALQNGLSDIEKLCSECEEAIGQFSTSDRISPGAVYSVLDIVARIEATVWDVPMRSDDFLSDVGQFVDASFDHLISEVPETSYPVDEPLEFEIDEETLEIFRAEAEELLSNIGENLSVLSASPSDQAALWEVRRNAHTFKGAAGIVGLKAASSIAHLMEDLLDKLVETRSPASPAAVRFLQISSKQLSAIATSKAVDDGVEDIDRLYGDAIEWLTSPQEGPSRAKADITNTPIAKADQVRTTTTPIVRVSLDRLDELIKISRNLVVNRSAIQERLSEVLGQQPHEVIARIESLFDAQRVLTDEIQTKLHRIRMVKFGTLETRLSRNVNVTCGDEAKKAVLEIENGDAEIDTQVIDALIEPLLHLLKNAVVHGIEPPETRRLIGKPERGTITVKIEADDEALVLSVADDGGGISPSKLREKAVASGILTHHQADSMNDHDSVQLIFDRGLTTAENINLNAGRGVGMSIVKEAVEQRGGTVVVRSEPQRGTTFTILMPLGAGRPISTVSEPTDEDPEKEISPLVLIVDDSASVRRLTTKLVEQAGLRVITANNGAEALELLLNGDWEPDLILSDVEMPQIDGWGFLEYVKTDANFGQVPVVMVTSLDAEKHRSRALELGASDYLIKPLKESDLTRVLDNLIHNTAV